MSYNGGQSSRGLQVWSSASSGDSKVRRPIFDFLSDTLRELRQQKERDGTLAEDKDPELLRLTKALRFGSPSAAAQFVAGCSVSGNRDWHAAKTNTPLGTYLREHSDKGT